MTKRSLDEARQFGRSLQPTHDLQAEAGAADGQSTFAILDVNEVQADAQPKKITLQGVANVVAPLLPPASIAAAGSNTQVQFNDGGYLGGDAGLTFNKTTDALTAGSFIPNSSTVPTDGVYLPSANNVAISTNGTGRLFIDANGDITSNTNPSTGLGVRLYGTATGTNVDATTSRGVNLFLHQTSNTNNNTSAILFVNALTNTGAYIAGQYTSHTNRQTALVFGTGDNAAPVERFRITSDGKVGLGTSSPRSAFDLAGVSSVLTVGATAGASARICNTRLLNWNDVFVGRNLTGTTGSDNYVTPDTGALGYGGIEFRVGGSTAIYGASGSTTAGGTVTPTARLFINSSGNVGIGTTGPSQKLSVEDAADTYALVKRTVSGSESTILIGAESGKTVIYSRDNSTGGRALEFAIGISPAARIDTSGRLLVGTSSARSNLGGGTQSARLQIEGTSGDTARISQIQNANNANAIQYIFAKSRGTTVGSNTIVQSGDGIGQLSFEGSDGTNFVQAASITGAVDGTPGADDMPGRLVFSTTADGAASPTERMRITSDAYVRLASGTGGIQFNGDTAAANALDDYEEGTWTPVYTPTTGSFTTMTMNVQSARYVKIGQLVTVQAYIVTSNVDVTGASGSVNITGLPFTSYSAQPLRRSGAIGFSTSFATAPQFWGIIENSTTINLYEARVDALDVADLSTGAGSFNIIWLEASYYAA